MPLGCCWSTSEGCCTCSLHLGVLPQVGAIHTHLRKWCHNFACAHHNYSARACAARGKVIEFVCLSVPKNFEIACASYFQDFWAYQKGWRLTYLYLPLGWLALTLWDFCCFLIIRSTLSATLFTATSHAHKLYATCTLLHLCQERIMEKKN